MPQAKISRALRNKAHDQQRTVESVNLRCADACTQWLKDRDPFHAKYGQRTAGEPHRCKCRTSRKKSGRVEKDETARCRGHEAKFSVLPDRNRVWSRFDGTLL